MSSSARGVHVVSMEEAGERSWEEYVAAHPSATAYHSVGWRQVFERSFGYRSWYLLARREEDGRIFGCLPLFLVASPFSRRLVAVPFRDRGGPLWDDPAALEALLRAARAIATRVGASSLELRSVERYDPELVGRNGLTERLYWVHSTADLRSFREFRELWTALGNKVRNMIRQAERAGLSFVDVPVPHEELRSWYQLHLATQQRLGLPAFPVRFFQNLLRILPARQEARLFMVRHDATPLAAAVMLSHRQTLMYGYSSSGQDSGVVRATDFLLFETLRFCLQNAYHHLDFGSDAPSQEGLLFFKRKWLAQQRPAPVYTIGRSDPNVSDSSSARYALLRRALRHLPRPAIQLAGTLITRYFG